MKETSSIPRIVIAGGSGMIGKACRDLFQQYGYEVIILTRRKPMSVYEIQWDPDKEWIASPVFENCIALLNLCGASISDHRWTRRYKKKLYDSRIAPTQFIAKLLREVPSNSIGYIGASAIGIYGEQGTRELFEDSKVNSEGFLANLVRAWESAHDQINAKRNITLRIGIVISNSGGFMAKLRIGQRFRLYPYFCNGKQILSWIQIEDLARLILYAIQTEVPEGKYNATSPGKNTHREFMVEYREVATQSGWVFSIPFVLLKIGFGELAGMLCEGADARPDKICRTGFGFMYPDIHSAIRHTIT